MNRKNDKKTVKQVLIDIELHKILKIKAIEEGTTIKSLLEDYLADILAVDKKGEYGASN